jgi:hypothetical protein
MQECIVGKGFCSMEIYGSFLGVNPEVTVLVCRSVGVLGRKQEAEKAHS